MDIRQEIQKLEESQAKLLEERGKVVDLDPSADVSGLADMFKTMVVVEVDLCKRVAHEYLKEDTSVVAAPVVTVSGGVGRGSSTSGFSATKRETVMLPKFSRDEKTSFLQYPVWKK